MGTAPDGPAAPDTGRRPLHLRPRLVLLVAAGGLIGAPARYGVSRALPHAADTFPTATFVTNVVGAFALGLLLEALVRRGDDSGARQLLRLAFGTGVLGAFTTFSTFAVEVELLLRDGRVVLALGYAVASLLSGLLATVAGVGLAARSTSAGTASATAGLPADPDAQDTRPGTGRGPR